MEALLLYNYQIKRREINSKRSWKQTYYCININNSKFLFKNQNPNLANKNAILFKIYQKLILIKKLSNN